MSNVMTVGLDLAKTTFFAVALNHAGKRQWRKKLSRKKLLASFANSGPYKIAMEACASAHYWARVLGAMGHEVALLPPQHVKGYLRGQKNDYNDAEAIADACLVGRIRPVRPKSVEEQDRQSLLRLRRQLINEQTRLINQTRGLLGEYGQVVAQGRERFIRELPGLLEDAENGLSGPMRELIARQLTRYQQLREELAWYDKQLQQQVKEDELCQRLMRVPGFGPVASSLFRNWLGDGQQYHRGRDASAALGLVPRQHTSGDKPLLLGITKKGDKELRSVLIHGARAVLTHAHRKDDPLSRWVMQVRQLRGFNKAVVALANKLARIGWVIVARGETYRPRTV